VLKLSFLMLLCLLPNYLSGQDAAPRDKADDDMQDMPGMSAHSFIQFLGQRETSGTDAEPNSTPTPMIMTSKGGWMLMFHAVGFLADVQQSGPRGGDKLFSANWTMPMAQRKLGPGTLTIRSMLSLEPATITDRRYPELFQQGETAYGKPIVDGQHPHDLFMELAAMYDFRIGENTMLSLYAAPVGGPALGPIAFPHRSSASENPMATLGHHLEDSTHISDDVVTLGLTYRNVRVEGSGFHGREPDEFRWNIDQGKIDSWSSRVSVNVRRNWSVQYSIGHLHSPEELSPTEDIERMTASAMYNRPLRRGNWASTIAWGRNRNLSSGNVGNGYLLESTLGFAGKNNVWTRIENVDRTNELLLDGSPLPIGFDERYFTRVQGYTAGYDREVGNFRHLSTAIGGQFTWFGVPPSLSADYGKHPVGGVMFLRVRVR
jgi:hypothetical protein